MCGLLGWIHSPTKWNAERWRIAQSLQRHRGPDGEGSGRFEMGEWCVELAHQRLAIIDLTSAGQQPMALEDDPGAGVLVYNGELYNYCELREELEALGVSFRSRTDTEVVLRALRHWGAEEALRRFNGMWAFAWLDHADGCLWLSRDRAGEKPLYLYAGDGELCFASEMKALLALVGKRLALDPQSIGEYLLQNLLDAGPGCLLQGVQRVPAAGLTRVELRGQLERRTIPYWEPPAESRPISDARSLAADLRDEFLDAVRIRLRSDVPVGVLLSGGLDSSAIAAATQHIVGEGGRLNLLSAVSRDSRFDESVHIDRVARHLGREPSKVVLDLEPDTAFELLEEAIWHNDAPVGSFSNVAHFLLMRRARELGVTVVLSGQGADELLCGYRKYLGFYVQQLVREGHWLKAARALSGFARQGTVLRQFSFSEGRRYLPKPFRPSGGDLRGEALDGFAARALGLQAGQGVESRQVADLEHYSIPTLTHFEDRMSMSASREVRFPFLDPRLLDRLLAMPAALKLRSGWTKHVLRLAVEDWLPPEIVWRKDKQGFINPESEWLKRELRPKVQKYFSPDSLIFQYRLVNRDMLLARYAAFCAQPVSGGSIWFREIFNPLSLEIWLRRFESHIAPP